MAHRNRPQPLPQYAEALVEAHATTLEEADQRLLTEEIRHDETLGEVLALPAKYRLPIYLFYYEGYSTKEIAELLSIKEATIRTQLHTGRKLLKLQIGGEGDD